MKGENSERKTNPNLIELLQSWKEKRSLSAEKAEVIREEIVKTEMAAATASVIKPEGFAKADQEEADRDLGYEWWLDLYQQTTINSINRMNAGYQSVFKTA